MTARQPVTYAVLAFGTTHAALSAERVLLDSGVPLTPIPTPKTRGELCGIALRILPADEPRAREILGDAGIEIRARAEIDDV